MTDSGPLWLQIIIASIPVLVALIGGTFALANTVGRRIERLKNLVEIRKDYLHLLNPDYALEKIMLRELQAIDHATTPILKWGRRLRFTAVAFLVGAYTLLALYVFGLISTPVLSWVGIPLGVLASIIGFGSAQRLDRRRKQFRSAYALLFEALDTVGEKPSGESEPQETPESDASADSTADKTEPTDSTGENGETDETDDTDDTDDTNRAS